MNVSKNEILFGISILSLVILATVFPVFTLIITAFIVVYTFIFGLSATLLIVYVVGDVVFKGFEFIKNKFYDWVKR